MFEIIEKYVIEYSLIGSFEFFLGEVFHQKIERLSQVIKIIHTCFREFIHEGGLNILHHSNGARDEGLYTIRDLGGIFRVDRVKLFQQHLNSSFA